jgi:hypothetical protein
MNFIAPPNPMKIAVIGGGISGMGAAYQLSKLGKVTLFESEGRLGGHARTVFAGRRGDQAVDTGFIVFNKINYPHLLSLFNELKVPICESEMSFGASVRGGEVEYGLKNFKSLFPHPKYLANTKYLKMLMDILKFNRNAISLATDPEMTIRELLKRLGTSDWFREYYLLPFSGAIWSTPKDKILDFPAHSMIKFFEHHALLSSTGQHQWYTVDGGSVQYVERLSQELVKRNVEMRLGDPVRKVRRDTLGIEILSQKYDGNYFDHVVFATHSDDTLKLLADPNSRESKSLGAIKYQSNQAVLHHDEAVMPQNKNCWASWVYKEDKEASLGPIGLTYWMNSLQPIPETDPMFVTLNSKNNIDPHKVYDEVVFRHPVYDVPALKAQKDLAENNGVRNTWFCGAWMKSGFHEDGLASAIDVADKFSETISVKMAAQ